MNIWLNIYEWYKHKQMKYALSPNSLLPLHDYCPLRFKLDTIRVNDQLHLLFAHKCATNIFRRICIANLRVISLYLRILTHWYFWLWTPIHCPPGWTCGAGGTRRGSTGTQTSTLMTAQTLFYPDRCI